MPIEERPIAVRLAVGCLFAVCLLGVFQGLAPETCTQRGLIAAAAGYVGGRVVVKAINAILVRAMVGSWINRTKGESGEQSS